MVDYLENMRKLRKENKCLTLELKLREEMSKKYRSILKDAWGNNEGVMNEVSKLLVDNKARKKEIETSLRESKKMIRLNNQEYCKVKAMKD